MFGFKWHTAESVAAELIEGLENGEIVLDRNDSKTHPHSVARRRAIVRRFWILTAIFGSATAIYAIATVGVIRGDFNGKPGTALVFPDPLAITIIVAGVGASIAFAQLAAKFNSATP